MKIRMVNHLNPKKYDNRMVNHLNPKQQGFCFVISSSNEDMVNPIK